MKSRILSTLSLCALLVTFVACEKAIIQKKVAKKNSQAQESLVAQEKLEFFDIEIVGANSISTTDDRRYFAAKIALEKLLEQLECKDMQITGETIGLAVGFGKSHKVESITASCIHHYEIEIWTTKPVYDVVAFFGRHFGVRILEAKVNGFDVEYNTEDKEWSFVAPTRDENDNLKVVPVNSKTAMEVGHSIILQTEDEVGVEIGVDADAETKPDFNESGHRHL